MIVACIGYFVLDIFVDGVFQDPFAKTVVYIFERIGMDELEAIRAVSYTQLTLPTILRV